MASQFAWSVRITVTSDDEVLYPSKCLVFQSEDPSDSNSRAWFTNVASPAQLQEYPEDAAQLPDSGEVQLPYFRLDTVQLIGRNPSEIQDLVGQFAEELTLLSRNLEALEIFQDEQVIPIS